MKHCLLLLSFCVQSALGQPTLQVQYYVDLNQPTHSPVFATPDYATWRSSFSFGSSIDLPISGPVYVRYSVDYARRVFHRYRHPLSGQFGYDPNKPAFGGDGSILRLSAGPSFRGRFLEAMSYTLHVGAMMTHQSYDDVHFFYSGFIDEDPYADPYKVVTPNNPSSVFFGLVAGGTVTYTVSDQIGLQLGVRTIQNEYSGYFWQSLVGMSVGL